jgi:hypothetical protein
VVATTLNRHKTSASADDRAEARPPVCLTALIINGDAQPETIHILNIARLGFLAKAARPRETGDAVIVQIEHIGKCEAHIVWANSEQFGGRFIQPIDTRSLP